MGMLTGGLFVVVPSLLPSLETDLVPRAAHSVGLTIGFIFGNFAILSCAACPLPHPSPVLAPFSAH